MIINGRIRIISTPPHGFDEDGNPLPMEGPIYSDYIDCNLSTNKSAYVGRYEDGEFKVASYTILIPYQPCAATLIEISNIRGEVLGKFRVQDKQYLRAVGRVRIQV